MHFRISLPRNALTVSRLRWKPRTVPCKTGRRDRRRDKTGSLCEKKPSHYQLCTCCMPSDAQVATLATNPIDWASVPFEVKELESDQKEDVKSFAQICTWPVCTLMPYASFSTSQIALLPNFDIDAVHLGRSLPFLRTCFNRESRAISTNPHNRATTPTQYISTTITLLQLYHTHN